MQLVPESFGILGTLKPAIKPLHAVDHFFHDLMLSFAEEVSTESEPFHFQDMSSWPYSPSQDSHRQAQHGPGIPQPVLESPDAGLVKDPAP